MERGCVDLNRNFETLLVDVMGEEVCECDDDCVFMTTYLGTSVEEV